MLQRFGWLIHGTCGDLYYPKRHENVYIHIHLHLLYAILGKYKIMIPCIFFKYCQCYLSFLPPFLSISMPLLPRQLKDSTFSPFMEKYTSFSMPPNIFTLKVIMGLLDALFQHHFLVFLHRICFSHIKFHIFLSYIFYPVYSSCASLLLIFKTLIHHITSKHTTNLRE